ncbi:hypothetical protein K1719_034755 [Acacia pycnantha]|nr:hypothetical protein K1719_034755 [Acacia pycnantha]
MDHLLKELSESKHKQSTLEAEKEFKDGKTAMWDPDTAISKYEAMYNCKLEDDGPMGGAKDGSKDGAGVSADGDPAAGEGDDK